MSVCGKDWHAEEIYGKMINSKWTYPVFTLEEFKKSNRKTGCFDVKCLKCGGVFKLRFDKNFYVRNGKASYFRCPVCFPFNSSRKTSGDEIELFEYVKGIFSAEDVLRGDRTTIYPYELDIHPAGEHFDFAIEYNGAYWHSIELNGNINRVLDKVKICEERGIKLIVLWEDDYLNDKEFYKKFIFDYVFNTAAVVDKLTNNGTRKNLELDRSVFNKCFSVPGYMLVGETQPTTMIRTRPGSSQKWTCPDAGKLIYEKT